MGGGSAVWKFLNSSFALWLLSAFFVTGFGSLYANYQANDEAERARVERIGKLDIEISYRYSQLLAALDESQKISAPTERERQIRLLLGSVSAKPGNGDSLYEDFQDYSLLALQADLKRLLPFEEGAHLDSVIGWVSNLRHRAQNLDLADPVIVGGDVQKSLLPRWRRTYFANVDCSEKTPFC